MDLFNYPILSFLTERHTIDYEFYSAVIKAMVPKNSLNGQEMPAFLEQPFKHIISIENLFKSITKRSENIIDIVSICFQIPTERNRANRYCRVLPCVKFYCQWTSKSLSSVKTRSCTANLEVEELESGIRSLHKVRTHGNRWYAGRRRPIET